MVNFVQSNSAITVFPYTFAVAYCGPDASGQCCDAAESSVDAFAGIETQLNAVGVRVSLSASCRCANANGCSDCTGSPPRFGEDADRVGWGYTLPSLSLPVNGGEQLLVNRWEAAVRIDAKATRCAASGASLSASAVGGIVLLNRPHPLNVPEIGENEYVWSSSIPAARSLWTLYLPIIPQEEIQNV